MKGRPQDALQVSAIHVVVYETSSEGWKMLVRSGIFGSEVLVHVTSVIGTEVRNFTSLGYTFGTQEAPTTT